MPIVRSKSNLEGSREKDLNCGVIRAIREEYEEDGKEACPGTGEQGKLYGRNSILFDGKWMQSDEREGVEAERTG